MWAYVPPQFGPTAVAVTGAEAALTSRLSVMAEGAEDTLDHRFSGMAAGLRLQLLPREAPLQLSFASGVYRDLSGAPVSGAPVSGASGLWSQINVSHDVGRWHFAGALRARAPSEDWNQTSLSGSGGVSVDLSRVVRAGLEYVVDNQALGSRSAVVPWIGLSSANGLFMLRIAGVIPAGGNEGFSLRLALVANF
jgi:hypothetical protein